MTLYYGLFDVSDPENPDRVYSAALLSRIISKHIRDGIVHGDGGELAVSASDPPAMSVQVGTGTAMVQGRFCESDAVLTLAVPAADTTYARIDRVVVRLSASPGRVIDILVKKGTPAPSPAPPGLTRTPETWELSLAQISVAAGATMVQAANITDERRDATLCGWACATYLPSSQLEITGPVDMQGKVLTGLPAPGIPTAATTKAYVDSEITTATVAQVNAIVPVGVILLWSGSIASIPPGWALCDGTNGTPDLRDRFVVGAGSAYAVGATGGEATHTLTTDEMPTHAHSYTVISGQGGTIAMSGGTIYGSYPATTGSAGGGQPHENRPPYYALAYIMRVA